MVFNTGLLALVQGMKITASTLRNDNDMADRLSAHYSVMLVVIFTVLVSANQYVGMPLKCWLPKHFSGSWEAYADNYCWVKNTYWVPPDSNLPDHKLRRSEEIGYYQWVPFILAVMAMLFCLPNLIWRLLNWSAGINVQSLVSMSCDASNVDPSKRKETMKTLARYIEDTLMVIDDAKSTVSVRIRHCLLCLCGTRRTGNYLTCLYLIVKILYIANVVGQFFLLNTFLGTDYKFYGVQMLKDLFSGREWTESGHFPRITMCDFSIRSLGHTQNYTVQCVLMINLFNEKIFIFLWFWFFLVGVVSVFSLFFWIYRMLIGPQRKSFAKHFAKITKSYDSEKEREMFDDFVEKRLRTDGIFLLRLINLNAGDIIITDLITELWQTYREKRKQPIVKKPDSDSDHLKEIQV